MKLNKQLSLQILFATATTLFAQERDVSKWVTIPCPKDEPSAEGALWNYRANYSKYSWRVFREGQKICAALTSQTNFATKEVPKFTLEAEHFNHASATFKVSDGWLVGFNRGEWGGALYWFGASGTANYTISKHPIVDFIQTICPRINNSTFELTERPE